MFSKLLTLILLIAAVWYGFRYRLPDQCQDGGQAEAGRARKAALPRPRPTREEMSAAPPATSSFVDQSDQLRSARLPLSLIPHRCPHCRFRPHLIPADCPRIVRALQQNNKV